MATEDTLNEVNQLLFCEQCNQRALDFLEEAVTAIRMAGLEGAAVIELRVEESLKLFLSLHERCLSCKEE